MSPARRKKNSPEATPAMGKGEVPKNSPTTKPMRNEMAADHDILELDMNLDEFEDYELLPKGQYPAVVTDAEKRTSDKGNTFFYVNFRIEPADYPADYDRNNAPEGTVVNFSRVQAPKGADRRALTNLKKFLKALGQPTNVSSIDPEDWKGSRAMLVIDHEEYNGEQRHRVTSVEEIA